VNNSAVVAQLASDSANNGNILGFTKTDTGSTSQFQSVWNSGTHKGYLAGPNGGNAVGALYLANSSLSKMGVAGPGCGNADNGDTGDNADVTFPLAATAALAPHYSPNWTPQTGYDSHLGIIDGNYEWWTITSGIITSTVLSSNSGDWPSTFYPFSATETCGGVACGNTYANCKSGAPPDQPGTVAEVNRTTSNGVGIKSTAGMISLDYSIRPEEIEAVWGGASPTHAITFTDHCDTYATHVSGAQPYVNWPAYGSGDQWSSTNDCANQAGGNNAYVDYGGLLASDAAPNKSSTPCNKFEYYLWSTLYRMGAYKNDNTGNFGSGYTQYFLTWNIVPDSTDTWNGGTSIWKQVASDDGDTYTAGSQYYPTMRNPSCGLSISADMMYLVPPQFYSTNSGAPYYTFGSTTWGTLSGHRYGYQTR
jgi:hypothetical protein